MAEHNAPDVHPLIPLSYDHPHFYILNSFQSSNEKQIRARFIYLFAPYPFDGYLEGKVSKPFSEFRSFLLAAFYSCVRNRHVPYDG